MATSSGGRRMRLCQGVDPLVPPERKVAMRMAWLQGTPCTYRNMARATFPVRAQKW